MRYFHWLEIKFEPDSEVHKSITEILSLEPKVENPGDQAEPSSWTYEVITENGDKYFDFINNFLDMLDKKFSALYEIGIRKENITFWLLYEYDQQCNLELDSIRMKRLGEAGITLCISCWDSGKIR